MKTPRFCIGKIVATFFVVVLVSSFLPKPKAVAEMDSPLLISNPAELARLKSEVVAWSNSLKSFKGCYSLVQKNYEHGASGLTPQNRFDMEVEYRFQGDNRYMALEMQLPDGSLDRNCAAQLNGVVQRRDDLYIDSEKEANMAVLKSRWPFPNGAYMLPTDLFGWDLDIPLEKRFEEGRTYLINRDGMRVLSHYSPAASFEIYLDEKNRVVRIDELFRPEIPLEELQSTWGLKEPFDVFQRDASIELDGYLEIDGVWTPTLAKRTTYSQDRRAYAEKCKHRFDAGEISIYEFQVCITTQVPKHISSVMDLQLDPGTITLNKKLSDRDFRIRMEDGMEVFEEASGEASYIYQMPWYARPITWGIAIAVLLLLGGGGVFWYVQRPA